MIAGIARLILVLMVAAFILIDLQRIRGFIRSLVPGVYRTDYDHIARRHRSRPVRRGPRASC